MSQKSPILSSSEDDIKGFIKKTKPSYSSLSCPRRISFRICFLASPFIIIMLFTFAHFIEKFNNDRHLIKNNDMTNKTGLTAVSKTYNATDSDQLIPKMVNELKKKIGSLENSFINCNNRDYRSETIRYGNFWVLKNYIKAEHNEIKCNDTITYTTHADYTFLDNVIPLLKRWLAPLSVAIYAPRTDFEESIRCINYLRTCLPDSEIVRQYATFHIYFGSTHIPDVVPTAVNVLNTTDFMVNCSMPEPYLNDSNLYRKKKNLLYPINVGRNVARDAALTYYVLPSDIELYPNPGLADQFLEMVRQKNESLWSTKPHVFPLAIFEIAKTAKEMPKSKTQLQQLLRDLDAVPFHSSICPSCHRIPRFFEWEKATPNNGLNVFVIAKRELNWEPVYIGTHFDPHYDERLSWEGKSDKMTQGYVMCVLDYDFLVLDNAFLIHKPGVKQLEVNKKRGFQISATRKLIVETIQPELKILYGFNELCEI